jgi:CheY-like chemotaxis protein
MTILIIDDSRTMRSLIRHAIEQAAFSSPRIVEAGNGAEALRVALTERPDVICCDIHLADMTGFEILKKLRENRCTAPLGFITSDVLPETRARALNEGAAFLINKPFTREALEQALRAFVPHSTQVGAARQRCEARPVPAPR